jgi:hypothetical protein
MTYQVKKPVSKCAFQTQPAALHPGGGGGSYIHNTNARDMDTTTKGHSEAKVWARGGAVLVQVRESSLPIA